MHDPLTVAVAMGEPFVAFDRVRVRMDDAGRMSRDPAGNAIHVSRPDIDARRFMDYLSTRLLSIDRRA